MRKFLVIHVISKEKWGLIPYLIRIIHVISKEKWGLIPYLIRIIHVISKKEKEKWDLISDYSYCFKKRKINIKKENPKNIYKLCVLVTFVNSS